MFAKHFALAILWTLLVGLLCGLPGNSFPDLSFWELLRFDSLAHTFVFTVYTFLWAVGLSKQPHKVSLRKQALPIAVLSGIAYGILLEILQFYIFYRRSAEWTDMLSDSLGCLAGALLFRLIYGPVLKEQ